MDERVLSPITGERSIHHHARGEVLTSSLASRSVRLANDSYGRFHHVLIVVDGAARLLDGEGNATNVNGPALAYLSPNGAATIAIAAGTVSILIGASPEIIADAIGNKAESFALRIFAENRLIISRAEPTLFAEVHPLVEGVVRELAEPDRESWMVISAYMRLIMMTMWRASSPDRGEQRGQGEVASLLQRFRQAVEVHFRERRPISDYAADLGITTDRLHAICQRTLGRSPLQLLHERLTHEAKLRLERSAGTIQQISDELGFGDQTYFSHFFKRNTSMTPAAYRKVSTAFMPSGKSALSSSYADWP